MGAQMRPLGDWWLVRGDDEGMRDGADLVCLIMNAIFSVVTSSAAMTRSPSFSRSVESRTMMNSPFLNALTVSSMLSKWSFDSPLGGIAGGSTAMITFFRTDISKVDAVGGCGLTASASSLM